MVNNKTISQYCDEDYLEYAQYVVEHRAIPSVIDGLKPTARKIVFIANKIWKTGKEKPLKVFQLGGKVSAEAFYHHGDCGDYDTPILLEDGSYIKIGEWAENYPNKKMNIIAFDDINNKFVIAEGCNARIGQITDKEYEIEMENGEIFKFTEYHPFLLKGNIWKYVKDLKEGDDIISYLT